MTRREAGVAPPSAPHQIAAFVAERNEALLSGDVDRVMALHTKYNPSLPAMPRLIAEIAMHKARMLVTTFSADVKAESAAWLQQRGYSTDFSTTEDSK